MTSQLLELGERASAPGAEQTRVLARLHLFDALVAASVGTATPEGASAVRHLESLRACLNAGTGLHEASPADIVLAVARLIRVTELDDLQLVSVTTAAAAIVPALTGAAAVAGKSQYGADDVLDAMTAGYDIMSVLGLAVGGPDFLYRHGGWPSLVAAGPAAAAVTGRLLGFDPEEIAHALALAVLSTPRSLRGSGEGGRWLSFGLAVTAGFQAALATRSGTRGDLALLEQEVGRGVPRREVFPGLRAALDLPGQAGCGLASAHLKQWASAGQVAAAIDAVGVLQNANGFAPEEVTAVDVYVPPAYRRMIDQPSGSGRMWSLVSAQYQIAARLLHPRDLFDCVRPVLRDSAGFRRLMGIVHVHEEELLADRHPESYPARVSVTLRNGTVADYLSDGRSPTRRWDWESVLAKAHAVAARAEIEERIDPLREAIMGFSDSTEFLRAVLPAVSHHRFKGLRPKVEGSQPEVAKDREDPAVVLGDRLQVQLAEDRGDVLLDRALRKDEGGGDAGVGTAFGHRGQDLALARRQRREPGALRAHQLADHLRVQRRSARGHALQRRHELRYVPHPVLQQVADPGGAAGQQSGGVGRLDVLREHQDPGAGMVRAQGYRRPQSFVGVRRGHPDVHDRRVGSVFRYGGQQRRAVPDGVAHGMAVVGEQPGQALSQDGGVLRDHDPHVRHASIGSSAVTTVGPPGGLETRNAPSTTVTRSFSPVRPEPRAASAPPTPSSATLRTSTPPD